MNQNFIILPVPPYPSITFLILSCFIHILLIKHKETANLFVRQIQHLGLKSIDKGNEPVVISDDPTVQAPEIPPLGALQMARLLLKPKRTASTSYNQTMWDQSQNAPLASPRGDWAKGSRRKRKKETETRGIATSRDGERENGRDRGRWRETV